MKIGKFYRPDLRFSIWLIYAVIMVSIWACGDEMAQEFNYQSLGSVRGTVDLVEARSLLEVSILEMTDEDGNKWRFEAAGFDHVTPSHLKDHQLRGLPLTVGYYSDNGILTIESITD